MKPLLVSIISSAALLLFVNTSFGGYLEAYYTTDPGVIDQKPKEEGETDWTEVDPNTDEMTINLDKGKSVWIACRNLIDEDPYKFLKIMVSGPKATEWGQTEAYTSNDDDDAVPAADLGSTDPAFKYWRFGNPQPVWERFEVIASEDFGGNQTFTVKVWSHCSETEPEWPAFTLRTSNASFGAQGAVIGDPHVTEIWMFPRNAAVDTSVEPSFSADPSTGNWTRSFVFVDPEGNPRPGGGVRWVSDGLGLAVSDRYEHDFAMVETVDAEYDLYAYETQASEYMDFKLVIPWINIPTVSEWGLIVMTLLLLTAGTVVIFRRRRVVMA